MVIFVFWWSLKRGIRLWEQKREFWWGQRLTWRSVEKILETTITQYVCLQTSLWSYLSVKTIGGVIRCPNRKLWPCTSVDSDFLAFMLPQQSFQYIVKMAKIAVFWGTFELWGSVENFLGVETTQTKYGKSSPNTREYTEKKSCQYDA